MCESVVQDAIRLQMSDWGQDGDVKTALTIGAPPPRHTAAASKLMAQAAQKCLVGISIEKYLVAHILDFRS